MTDKELLELAAKAAGHRIVEWAQDGNGIDVAIIIRGGGDGFSKRPWQPLLENQMTDADGDALRLAVKIGATISQQINDYEVIVSAPNAIVTESVLFVRGDTFDPRAATRRAITRAAAEIGKGMP
jgi:hypothetical protein